MLISVIFSFRNEEQVLNSLIDRVVSAFEHEPEECELVFVNDNSTDSSLDILMRRNAQDSRVKIVNMSNRFGVSECVLAGMSYASGDAVIYMDTDLQDPPEVIPELLKEWRAGAQVVHTQRIRRLGESPLKMKLTRLAYKLITLGSNTKFPIDAGDFKLLARPVVDQLVQMKETDPYLRGLIVWIGFKQTIVQYERQARVAGKAHFPWFSKNPWVTVVSGLTSFSFVPIFCVAAAAAIGMLLTVGMLIGGLFFHPSSDVAKLGYWLATMAIFLFSITQLSISAIGIYILRAYKDVRQRPAFVVKDTIGFGDSSTLR